MKIRYSNLKSGDIVICGGRSPLAWLIRWVTAGFNRRHAANVSSHTGILTQVNGQILIAEMTARGLELNSLEKYNRNRRRYIIDIVRKPIDELQRINLDCSIAKDRRRTIEYSYRGDLAFVFKKIRVVDSQDFCSEYVARKTARFCGVKWGEDFDKIAPNEIQIHCSSKGYKPVQWRKDG